MPIHSAATLSLRSGGKKLAGGGVAGGSTPGRFREAGRPDRGARRSLFKGLQQPVRPTSAEEVILDYKRVQGGFEGASVGKEAAKEEESDVLNKRLKVPTASPTPSSMWPFAGLSGGRY